MRKIVFTLFALMSCVIASAQFSSAPAFPGAEGHGRFVTGGRGGNVIHVTNLNDNGTGSLRSAVKGSARKIIVFDVAGVIALNSDLSIGDNTTILGQTAPEPGITVRYYTVSPGNNNIIRFMRFRRGQERDINDGADASNMRYKTGTILDHCSFSWSIDEVASFYDNNNFTMQWCTIAESLVDAGHGKGAHGYGGIWGGKLASFHHNMIAHVVNRGPRFNGARYMWSEYTKNQDYATYKWSNTVEAENVDFRNCVMYNAQGTCYGGPGGGQINIVNNYYKAGPGGSTSTTNQERVTTVSVGTSGNSTLSALIGMTSRYYINGNTTVRTDGTVKTYRDWDGITYDDGVINQNGTYYTEDKDNYYTSVEHTTIAGKSCVKIKMDAECPKGFVTTHSAETAYEKVLQYVGASLYRDDVDRRYVQEAQNCTATYTGSTTGKAGLIDLVSDCNGYTEATFPTGTRPDGYDTDGDGMPDEWEVANGLNPNVNDANRYNLDSRCYYTNIEVYAHSLVENIIKSERQNAIDGFEEYYPDMQNGETEDNAKYYETKGATPTVTADDHSTFVFSDGAAVVMTGKTVSGDDKKYAVGNPITYNGNEDTYYAIKVSNGAENKFVAPAGKYVSSVKIVSYINNATGTRTTYWREVGGHKFATEETDAEGKVTYTPTADAQIHASRSGSEPDVCTFNIGGKSEFTFTNIGEQVAFILDVTYGQAAGITSVNADRPASAGATYNIMGQRVQDNARGIVIRGGKKYVVR